jgi:hypothetical protein
MSVAEVGMPVVAAVVVVCAEVCIWGIVGF